MSKASHIVTFALLYEDIEKSPYYYKARYERILKQRQADLDRQIQFISNLYCFGLKTLQKLLYCVLWAFIRLVWGLAYVVEKTYDFVAWSVPRAHNRIKQLKRSLLCPLLYSLAKRVRIVR